VSVPRAAGDRDALRRPPAGGSGWRILRRRPVAAAEAGGLEALVTAAGDLRTLPCHLPDPVPQLAGMDGFYAARLERL